MLGYDSLPSLQTRRGKLFWAGMFGLLAVSCAVSAAIGRNNGG